MFDRPAGLGTISSAKTLVMNQTLKKLLEMPCGFYKRGMSVKQFYADPEQRDWMMEKILQGSSINKEPVDLQTVKGNIIHAKISFIRSDHHHIIAYLD
jgi:hypothetical protein